MITPVIPRKLFEVNQCYDIQSFDDEILIVDNFYKNYDDIYAFLVNSAVDIFNDPGPEAESSTKNFVDYYQCRPSFFYKDRFTPQIDEIKNIIKHYFRLRDAPKFCRNRTGPYEFNFFRFINLPPQEIQGTPHLDYELGALIYNAIVYFDKVCSGGTAIYECTGNRQGEVSQAFRDQNIYAGIDVSQFKKKIIQAKPNRLAIFKGNRFHNGYIGNHRQYLDNWRIVQVMFFK